MFVQLNAIVIDPDANNRSEMTAFLTQHGVHVSQQLPGVEPLGTLLQRADAAQLVVINLDPNAHETLKRIGHLPRQFPTISFFVLSQLMDAHLLMEAMHLGVKEFIPLPIQSEKFASAIERVAGTYGMGKKAKVIHVIPTMGGCGSTTIACNVAASMAKTGKTALLDLDLVRGGVASYFDLRPRYTIADVMDQTAALDMQLLDNALARHGKSGLGILSRPELPEDTQRVTHAGFGRLMGMVGRMFDYVVLDSMMSIDPVYAAAIAAADVNVIVMQLNVPSAKNAERFVGALRRMGIESSKMKIVVNRYVKKGWDIDPEEVERALGLKISWLVPNDFKNAIESINFGEPVVIRAPRSEISTSLTGLAQMLNAKATAAAA
ncbi:MAG TPA: AAA family ATPase [Tepidisphaeraceae bacterium]|jgi:pilus assembly protein CpaE